MATGDETLLEAERAAFGPFEALSALDDDRLDVPVAGAGGWSGRDLMGHIAICQEPLVEVIRELAAADHSPAMDRLEAEWAVPGAVDRINEAALARFRALPVAEVRAYAREMAEALRAALAALPSSRLDAQPEHRRWLTTETVGHYGDHERDLAAILEAARPGGGTGGT